MKIGSIVEVVGDFEGLRKDWGFCYPKTGDLLTVRLITKHPNSKISNRGIVLLHFEEMPNFVGLCDKQVNGEPNFTELRLPPYIEEIFKLSDNKVPKHNKIKLTILTKEEVEAKRISAYQYIV